MLNSFGKALTGISLNALALGAVGWVGWDVWRSGILNGYAPEPAEFTSERLDAGGERVNINAIARAHLFGSAARERKVVERKEAPPTRLNLKLVGVIAIGTANQGIALIEAGRGRQQVVRVGQVIGNTDAKLAEVQRDHVLIERNGELERLAIKRPELESQPIKSLPDNGTFTDAASGGASQPEHSSGTVLIEPAAQLASEAPPESSAAAGRANGEDPDGSRLTLPF